jgi:mannosyl-oligosaccharide alpha-1,2-mannosidase
MVYPGPFALSAVALSVVSALSTDRFQDVPHATYGKRQYSTIPPAERAQAVVDTFKLSWEGYYRYAFPNDELKPVTNSFGNSQYTQPRSKQSST